MVAWHGRETGLVMAFGNASPPEAPFYTWAGHTHSKITAHAGLETMVYAEHTLVQENSSMLENPASNTISPGSRVL